MVMDLQHKATRLCPHSCQSPTGATAEVYRTQRRALQLSRAKLKASSRTSALLAGFAMVAMVELQLDKDNPIPPGLLLTFSICTVLLVSTHLLALMISTCILPYVDAIASNEEATLEEINESPHERMSCFVEIAWVLSTLVGILLFLVEVFVICWTRFANLEDTGRKAAMGATIVLIPILVVFVAFAIHFYRKLATHRVERTVRHLKNLIDDEHFASSKLNSQDELNVSTRPVSSSGAVTENNFNKRGSFASKLRNCSSNPNIVIV